MSTRQQRIGIIGYGAIGQQITSLGLGPKAEYCICSILVKAQYASAYSQGEDLPFVTGVTTFPILIGQSVQIRLLASQSAGRL